MFLAKPEENSSSHTREAKIHQFVEYISLNALFLMCNYNIVIIKVEK